MNIYTKISWARLLQQNIVSFRFPHIHKSRQRRQRQEEEEACNDEIVADRCCAESQNRIVAENRIHPFTNKILRSRRHWPADQHCAFLGGPEKGPCTTKGTYQFYFLVHYNFHLLFKLINTVHPLYSFFFV